MQYRGLKVGVFYKHLSWAETWMKDFLNAIDHSCVLRFVKNGYSPFMIELKDGTTITACCGNDSSKGRVFDKAFVEPNIGQEIIDCRIRPMVRSLIVIDD